MSDINSILFVCLGNICRSPTAEAIMRAKSSAADLNVIIDSAGTSDYHIGETPDPRTVQAGERAGYSFAGQHARQVTLNDFYEFDLILAMDSKNLSVLKALQPRDSTSRLALCLSYLPDGAPVNVPDPYYSGERGFIEVIQILESALNELIARHWSDQL